MGPACCGATDAAITLQGTTHANRFIGSYSEKVSRSYPSASASPAHRPRPCVL